MASREQAIRDRFAKGELTHPEATRMLGDLIAEGEEYKAWSNIEHDTSEPQMRERADEIGDKDAADTQAALKDAKTVGEALTAVREHVSPKWQKFIDGLMSKPEAMTGKFELSGISKTNLVTNAARLGEHVSGDITLHNGAGVSTLLHEAVHAKTVWGIDNDPAFRKEVQAVFDAAKKSGEFTGQEYMFKDLYEFVAEASTKPELQASLDKIASPKGKTLFGRLIDAIRKLLGLQPGQKSLLQDVLEMVEMAPYAELSEADFCARSAVFRAWQQHGLCARAGGGEQGRPICAIQGDGQYLQAETIVRCSVPEMVAAHAHR